MPLSPSPDESVHLEHTLSNIDVLRWTDDGQRVVILVTYDPNTTSGRQSDGTPDYEHAAQLVCLEELDELISALNLQRNWLADQGPSPEREWAVHVTRASDEGDLVSLLGPYTKAEADAEFEILHRGESEPEITEIQVLPLQRQEDQ